DEVVVNVLTGKGQLRDRFDDHVGRTRSGVADRYSGSKQGEIDELAAVDRKALDFLLIDDGAHHRARRFGHFADILYRNLLRDLAYGEVEIDVAGRADVQVNFLGRLLESRFFCRDGIVAGRDGGDLI